MTNKELKLHSPKQISQSVIVSSKQCSAIAEFSIENNRIIYLECIFILFKFKIVFFGLKKLICYV